MKKELLTAEKIFKDNGGIMRTSQAIAAKINPRVIYEMLNIGKLVQISRGVYRLASLPPISNPDIVTVAIRYPRMVICLISALSFYEMTTQIPHQISIAFKTGDETPRIDYPPIIVHRFSIESYNSGIQEHIIDGIKVKIYSPEKTLADCFKFRNKIGKDIVLEALQLYKQRKKIQIDKLLEFARICRVENIMQPYLETIL